MRRPRTRTTIGPNPPPASSRPRCVRTIAPARASARAELSESWLPATNTTGRPTARTTDPSALVSSGVPRSDRSPATTTGPPAAAWRSTGSATRLLCRSERDRQPREPCQRDAVTRIGHEPRETRTAGCRPPRRAGPAHATRPARRATRPGCRCRGRSRPGSPASRAGPAASTTTSAQPTPPTARQREQPAQPGSAPGRAAATNAPSANAPAGRHQGQQLQIRGDRVARLRADRRPPRRPRCAPPRRPGRGRRTHTRTCRRAGARTPRKRTPQSTTGTYASSAA